jgi:tRNA A-37 threonylcarbamoyl transferase component Bud32
MNNQMINCPDDKILNPQTNRCVKKTGKIGKKLLNKSKSNQNQPPCPDDKILNPQTNRCVKKTGKIGKKLLNKSKPNQNQPPCPDDKILNPETNRCVKKTGKIGKKLLNKSKPNQSPMYVTPFNYETPKTPTYQSPMYVTPFNYETPTYQSPMYVTPFNYETPTYQSPIYVTPFNYETPTYQSPKTPETTKTTKTTKTPKKTKTPKTPKTPTEQGGNCTVEIKPSNNQSPELKSDIVIVGNFNFSVSCQLGKTGKEGTTFLIYIGSKEYANKTFNKSKSFKKIIKEAEMQQQVANYGLAPPVLGVNSGVPRSIIMDKMEDTLPGIIQKQKGVLSKKQQKAIFNLFKKMDNTNILHNDPNPLNVMVTGDNQWKLIDFGFSKKLNKKTSSNIKSLLSLLFSSSQGINKLLKQKPLLLLTEMSKYDIIRKDKRYTQHIQPYI